MARFIALTVVILSGCSEQSATTNGESEQAALSVGVVQTVAGLIEGELDAEKNVHIFRGVHYGQSTAGSNRFLPPRPVEPWEGVKSATQFGDTCPQGGEVGRRTNINDNLLNHSEDCLVLNVWTPALDDQSRPVLVWFHGRGFYAGAGSEPLYDSANFAIDGDVVVVTVNHRLNVFGHLYLVDAGGEQFASSGNAGVQDMQLALEWVRDNISAFGGDAGNVSIFGESGGGAKVSTLLGVPSAKGLFQRGMIQSGPRLQGMNLDLAKQNTKAVMEKLSVTTVEELQALPFETVLAAVTTTGRTTPNFGPVVDGHYLPRDMFAPDSAPSAVGVPIIIGANRDEYALYERSNPNYGKMTEEELAATLRPMLREGYDDILTAYRASRPEADPWDLMVAIRSNRFHINTIRLAEVHSRSAPVYFYSFDFEPTERLGAAHGQEIAFVFGNATDNPNARPGADTVQTAMRDAWVAFAKTGNPNHSNLPEWPTYDEETRAGIVFDNESKIVNDIRPLERKVWEGKTLVR